MSKLSELVKLKKESIKQKIKEAYIVSYLQPDEMIHVFVDCKNGNPYIISDFSLADSNKDFEITKIIQSYTSSDSELLSCLKKAMSADERSQFANALFTDTTEQQIRWIYKNTEAFRNLQKSAVKENKELLNVEDYEQTVTQWGEEYKNKYAEGIVLKKIDTLETLENLSNIYDVTITETRKKTYRISALNVKDAETQIIEKWKNGEIKLSENCKVEADIVGELSSLNRENGTHSFIPIVGTVYKNNNSQYRCLAVSQDGKKSVMQNIISPYWTCTAHNCHIKPDNTIEWDYSTNGKFAIEMLEENSEEHQNDNINEAAEADEMEM